MSKIYRSCLTSVTKDFSSSGWSCLSTVPVQLSFFFFFDVFKAVGTNPCIYSVYFSTASCDVQLPLVTTEPHLHWSLCLYRTFLLLTWSRTATVGSTWPGSGCSTSTARRWHRWWRGGPWSGSRLPPKLRQGWWRGWWLWVWQKRKQCFYIKGPILHTILDPYLGLSPSDKTSFGTEQVYGLGERPNCIFFCFFLHCSFSWTLFWPP